MPMHAFSVVEKVQSFDSQTRLPTPEWLRTAGNDYGVEDADCIWNTGGNTHEGRFEKIPESK